MPIKLPVVTCPKCTEEYKLFKFSKEGDYSECPNCKADLEVIWRNDKYQVILEKGENSGINDFDYD